MKFLLSALLLVSLSGLAAEERLHWFDDFDKAMAYARAEDRPLFLDFYAEWCGPCKLMDRETYTDTEVAALIKANYVAVRIDVEEHYALAKKYSANALPMIMIISTEDKELYRHNGFLSAQELKDELLTEVEQQ